MRLLLDTCTFLWMAGQPDRLSDCTREALRDSDNLLFLHQASTWEMQIKYQTGKLRLKTTPASILREGLKQHRVDYTTLADSEIWLLQKLPSHHRDPFDRILIASASAMD